MGYPVVNLLGRSVPSLEGQEVGIQAGFLQVCSFFLDGLQRFLG